MEEKDKEQIIDREEIILESIDSKKIRRIKKKLTRIFFVFVILLSMAVFPIFFYKKELNRNLLSVSYKKGVYHIHSTFSDGTGNIDKISKAAQKNNLDFILMTDHGRPNVKCSEATGWENGVLIIGGSEFSLNCGHLATAGYDFKNKRDYVFPPEPQEAINDVNKTEGITFISHPLDGKIPWTDWDIEGFTGIEILNSYSSAKKTSILNLLQFPIQYLFNHNYALLNTLSYPKDNFKLWDDFNNKGDYYGIYALDAHSKLPITRKLVFMWPTYEAMFNIFTVYVKIDRDFDRDPEYSAQYIIDSIRKGKFFSVIEAIAPANGFEAFFIGKNGISYDIGSKVQDISGSILLKLPFSFKTNIVVKRNGKDFKIIKDNYKKELRISISNRGTYRVEVFVSDNTFNKLPWILANPFFIGKRTINKEKNIVSRIKRKIIIYDNLFKIEKNNNSVANLSLVKNNSETILKVEYSLRKQKDTSDFWVALAQRRKLNFLGYSGITFKTKSDKARRFWLELRTKQDGEELNYKHSFLSDTTWQKVFIPFNKLKLEASKNKKLNLSKVIALFFSLNNSLSYVNASGTLEITDIGLF